MRLYFEFTQPRSRDAVRAAFEAMGSAIIGRAISLKRVEYSEVSDRNGYTTCFVAKWTDGSITYDESLLNTDGNPRDGYGYDLKLTLTLPKLTLRAGGDHNDFRHFTVEFAGTGRDWLTLRTTLRREFGDESDRCAKPWVAYEVLPLLERQAALALAQESLASSKKGEIGREDVVEWLAANDASAGGPAMRVREAPAALPGWLELERSGDSTLAEPFARLCPYDLSRWKAAGLRPAPWFAHPAWPFERDDSAPENWKTIHLSADHVWSSFVNNVSKALTGWASMEDWNDVSELADPVASGWRWRTSRRARVPEGTKFPLAHVTLEGFRRNQGQWELEWEKLEKLNFVETLTWSWIGGPKTGDALLIVTRSLPARQNAVPTSVGIAFTVVGTNEFRERAEAAVIKESHYRWHPVSARASLDAWIPEAENFPDARAALAATVSPERFARALELLTCRCAQPGIGYCAHRVEMLGYVREDERGPTPAAFARSAAWNAAFYSVGDRPQVESVNRNLSEAYRAHVRAREYVD